MVILTLGSRESESESGVGVGALGILGVGVGVGVGVGHLVISGVGVGVGVGPYAIRLRNPDIRSSVEIWPSSFQPNQRQEKVLTRLRIGHTHMTHNHILKGDDPPVCEHCQNTLTVEHMLVECPGYSRQRRRFDLEGKSLRILLGQSVDFDRLMGFLKDINIFNKI